MTENNFLDFISQRTAQLENGGSMNNDNRVEPENGYLRLSKNKPSAVVRVLPHLDYLEGNEKDPIGIGYRYLFFQTPHFSKSGKPTWANIKVNNDTETEQIINRWQAEQKLTNRFGEQDSIRFQYMINVMELDPTTLQPITGKVQVMEISFALYKKMLESLQDTNTWAQGADMGFMDLNAGQPVKITRPQAQGESYGLVVYMNKTLPAIDVEQLKPALESLKKFTATTRTADPDWFNRVVGWVDGEPTTSGNDDYVAGNAASSFPTQPHPQGNPYVQSSSNQPQPQPQAQVASQAQGNSPAAGTGNWMPQGQGQAPQQQPAPFQQATTGNQPSGLATANGQSPFGGGQQTIQNGNGQANQPATSGNDDLDAQLNAILGN